MIQPKKKKEEEKENEWTNGWTKKKKGKNRIYRMSMKVCFVCLCVFFSVDVEPD